MKKLLVVLALLCAPVFGQVYSEQAIQNTQGNWLKASPGAAVHVCLAASTMADCISGSAHATIYTDQNLNVSRTNPITADSNGNFTIFANPATYNMCVVGATTYCELISVPGNASNHITCPAAINGSIAAFTDTTTTSCDPSFLTDFAGNFTAQSGQFLGPVNGFITFIGGGSAPGTQVKYALPANSIRFVAPGTVSTPYYFVPPNVRCAVGQVWGMASETTDANGNKVDTYQCQNSAAGGVEAQVGGTDISNCTGGPPCSSPLLNFVAGSNVTITNTSGGNIQIAASTASAPQASNPSAPVLTTNGSAGSTSYTYLVVGCQDGPTCSYHSAASSTTAIATGNATLSGSNSINIKTYADTLYGYRCYNIYRTASAGTPSSTGKIASCVWKQFIDTGLAGDGATAPNTNTTVLDANGLTAPLPGCNKMPAAPWGIDGPPCSPNAMDDEFTWGGTFLPGDTNDPQWTWLHQGTATATLTNGMLSLSSATTAADSLSCLIQPLPSAPYKFVELGYDTTRLDIGNRRVAGFGFYESGTGKLELIHQNSQFDLMVTKWTSTTVVSANQLTGQLGSSSAPMTLQVSRDGSNNISFAHSQDGIVFATDVTVAVNNFFTTAPDNVAICLATNNAGTSQSVTMDVDYFRRTQ